MKAPAITWAVLEGEQVRLRPFDRADAEAAFPLIHEREPILRWLVWGGPTEVSELEAYFGQWIRPHKDGADYGFAIEECATGAFAGSITVRFAGHSHIGDLGYWLGEPFWGRGFVTEAIGLITHLAFTRLGATSLCAWVFVGNDPSRRALEKNGFTHVRTVLARVRHRGKPQDEWYLALLRSEWERARGATRPLREDVRLI